MLEKFSTILKKETTCSGKNMEAVTKLAFDNEINTARSQSLFITASQSKSKSSRDYPNCHACHTPQCFRQRDFKGGTQCIMGLGIPQLLTQSNVALFGSAVLLEVLEVVSRCLRSSDCEGVSMWQILLDFKRFKFSWVSPQNDCYWSQGLCHCKVPTRKVF